MWRLLKKHRLDVHVHVRETFTDSCIVRFKDGLDVSGSVIGINMCAANFCRAADSQSATSKSGLQSRKTERPKRPVCAKLGWFEPHDGFQW